MDSWRSCTAAPSCYHLGTSPSRGFTHEPPRIPGREFALYPRVYTRGSPVQSKRTKPCSRLSIRTSTCGTSTKFKLAWFDPKTPEGKILGHSFTPKEYAEATKGLNVVKAVYMEVDVVPEQQQKEADYIIELCESGKTPTCAAVVSGRPNSEGFEKWAKQFKGHKYVKGIRQVLHVKDTPAGYCLDDKFVKGIQLLGDLGLSFDICVRPRRTARLHQAHRQVPGHAVHPRSLRQREHQAHARRAREVEEGHDRDRQAQEHRRQGERLHRDGAELAGSGRSTISRRSSTTRSTPSARIA